jgi:hypothetical protein
MIEEGRADEKVLLHEMNTLRQELRRLKDCQVRYLLFSLTASIAVIGLGPSEPIGSSRTNSSPFLSIRRAAERC